MTAVTSLSAPPDGWTVDDVPDEEGTCVELVDGALLVSPAPRLWHVHVASRLHSLLAAAVPAGLVVVEAPGLVLDRRNYRQPDLAVVREAAFRDDELRPADVLLVVEVMSGGSVANDRVAKPAQYAAAGISHYWRVEPDPRVLVRYVLHGDVYRETGRDDGVAHVREPVAVRVDVPALFPPVPS